MKLILERDVIGYSKTMNNGGCGECRKSRGRRGQLGAKARRRSWSQHSNDDARRRTHVQYSLLAKTEGVVSNSSKAAPRSFCSDPEEPPCVAISLCAWHLVSRCERVAMTHVVAFFEQVSQRLLMLLKGTEGPLRYGSLLESLSRARFR
jgi:hypothetical protein